MLLNSSGKYKCDLDCIRYKSYKICFHNVAAAEHKSEMRNFVEYFEKYSKNKVNDLLNVNMSSKAGQYIKGKGKPQNQSSNTTPTKNISPLPPNPNSSIEEPSFRNVSNISSNQYLIQHLQI